MTVPAPRPPIHAPKTDWRRWARTLSDPTPGAVAAVVEHLGRFLATIDGIVLGYAALHDEVDVTPCLADRPAGTVALPRLDADGSMTLHLDDGDRERHAFGVDQPLVGAPTVDAADLAAVLVPGRIFDRHGYRLGRGGGHYDRLLAALGPGVPTIGVVTAERVVDAVPAENHDLAMSHLATESGVAGTGSTRA